MPSQLLIRVLVVEDNPADARLVREGFGECGYRCELIFTETHADAKRRLAAEQFNLLLADFGTDYAEAQEFLRFARTTAPTMPIIVLSNIMDPAPAYAAGANAFIRKRNDIDQFFTAIRILMQFWIDVAELPPHQSVACA